MSLLRPLLSRGLSRGVLDRQEGLLSVLVPDVGVFIAKSDSVNNNSELFLTDARA